MSQYRGIILGILGCLLIAAAAFFWATGIIESLYDFRSPLHDNPPAPGAPSGQPLTRRVVFVLIDALREDTSLDPEVMPFLDELRAQGAWATMHSRPPSYSDPGYSVLMIGAWPDISDGPAMNLEYEDTPTWTQDNLFRAAHRAGLRTAVSGYYWFEKLIPQETVDASFYTPGEDAAADREVVTAALSWLESGDYQFILIHLDQVDYAGHYEGGPRDPRWDAAARRADDLTREIASYLDLRQDTVIVVSDHGQIARGGHGGDEPVTLTEPFVIAGAGVEPGRYTDIQMVDIAPTVAALLGTNLPASSQGRVLSEMLTLTPAQEAQINAALAVQKTQLLSAYQAAINSRADPQPPADSISGARLAMDEARDRRLARERLPRFVLAAVLALAPAAVLYWKRGKKVAWLVGGAAIYTVLFHLRYAVFDRRTYSLSSVASPEDIIMFAAVTAAIALVIAWLVVSLRLGIFGQPSRQAAETTLAFTFVTLYSLALPILLSFVLNGIFITWTLPDFSSMFVGFLSTLQSLVVAAVGLALAGVAAGIAALRKRT